jgi:hypothetical protein
LPPRRCGHFTYYLNRTNHILATVRRFGIVDANNLRHNTAHLGGRVELALALTALGRKVAHQVFIGVAQNVVALGAVLTKIERSVLKNGDQVGEGDRV